MMSQGSGGLRENPFLICPICMTEFDEKQHQAKLLPCSHTFCIDCLRQLANGRPFLDCPSCRKRILLPERGVRGLQTNFYITHIMEMVTEKTNSLSFNRDDGCRRHSQQPLSFYCTKCEVPICRDCTVLDHNTTKNHEIKDVAEIVNSKRKILQATLDKMNTACSMRESYSAQLEHHLGKLMISRIQTKSEIDRKFDHYVACVNMRRDRLKQKLERMYHKQYTSKNNQLKTIQKQIDFMKRTQMYFAKSLKGFDNSMTSTLYQMRKHADITAIAERVNQLAGIKIPAEYDNRNHDKQYFEFMKNLGEEAFTSVLENLGKITSCTTDTKLSRSPKENESKTQSTTEHASRLHGAANEKSKSVNDAKTCPDATGVDKSVLPESDKDEDTLKAENSNAGEINEDQAKLDTATNVWECTRCKVANKLSLVNCELCGYDRSHSATSGSDSDSTTEEPTIVAADLSRFIPCELSPPIEKAEAEDFERSAQAPPVASTQDDLCIATSSLDSSPESRLLSRTKSDPVRYKPKGSVLERQPPEEISEEESAGQESTNHGAASSSHRRLQREHHMTVSLPHPFLDRQESAKAAEATPPSPDCMGLPVTWYCRKCSSLNFSNDKCARCNASKEKGALTDAVICPLCNQGNSPDEEQCKKCSASIVGSPLYYI